MDIDREISRLALDHLNIVYRGTIYKYFYPNISLIEESYTYKEEMLDKLTYKGLWSNEECLIFLKNRGWYDQEKINHLENRLENAKIDFFKNRTLSGYKAEQIKVNISAIREEISRQYSYYNKYYAQTAEYHAEDNRQRFLIERSTFSGDKLIDDYQAVQFCLNKYFDSLYDAKTARKIARTSHWRNMWILFKPNMFSKPYYELSVNQKAVLIYSLMYDNVYNHHEIPTDEVIENDDALDGWFIVQKREAKQAQQEKLVDKSAGKIKPGANEVFVVAKDKEQAKAINNMNDFQGQMVKKQRQQIMKQKQKTQQSDFVDHKLEIQQKTNEQFKNRNK